MRGSEIPELDLLLYLARALPPGRSLRIRVRSLWDAELARRLALLRREQGHYEADVRAGLLSRLRRRLPHPQSRKAWAPRERMAGFAAAARRTWAHAASGLGSDLRGPKAVYFWVALSTLTLAVLLLSPLSGGDGRGVLGVTAVDGGGRYARPPLIIGY